MKYIEFLGIPGSGKTTVAQDVVRLMQANYPVVLNRWNVKQETMRALLRQKSGMFARLLYLVTAMIKTPLLDRYWGASRYHLIRRFLHQYSHLLPQVVENAERIAPPSNIPPYTLSSEQLLSWFFDVACIYQASQETLEADGVLVMEEGFCQQAYYLIAAFREADDIGVKLERYCELIPKPSLVIFLLADPEACEKRLHTRATGIPSSILSSLTASERIALFTHRLSTYQALAQYLEQQHVPVMRVDNTQPYHVTQKILEESLARCVV